MFESRVADEHLDVRSLALLNPLLRLIHDLYRCSTSLVLVVQKWFPYQIPLIPSYNEYLGRR